MTHSAKIISALLIVAATTGTALAAAGISPPSQGSGDFDTMRAAPINFPDFKPVATPRVDPDAQGRGPFDTEAAVAAYATVTLNRDGSVDETPAPDDLRALIELMLANPGA